MTKKEQGVAVTAHRVSTSQTGQVIVRFELPTERVGDFVDVLMRAVRDGYTTKDDELRLFLTIYDGAATTSTARLGVVRQGATARMVEAAREALAAAEAADAAAAIEADDEVTV